MLFHGSYAGVDAKFAVAPPLTVFPRSQESCRLAESRVDENAGDRSTCVWLACESTGPAAFTPAPVASSADRSTESGVPSLFDLAAA